MRRRLQVHGSWLNTGITVFANNEGAGKMIIWSNVNVSPITTLLTGFTRSSSLFFRLTNDLYVTDCENSRMQVFLANQTPGTTINVQDVNGTIL